ncbi:dihydrolipoyllysine-residue acetyltransferase [Pseudoluteimonas lycopersici]|uniref:Dihydrolipoamide acetyltransferase component of pyruvate dehydrogenase complex n=1 Tax=Pseudoluteimonas lycopersici TaxID=1324796 RepID=A0A516V5N1_9GAMM|nr:dihydrolipoyllysine-residue acetyltransferase [Lysobacter lycopersici]QDQ73807.1 dihydrolipoyllysine-residue acetyltransferase [Lysobacter lycopersici]
MAAPMEARVPDIGGYDDVPVIEVLVKPGDVVTKDQGLVTLESDKATMEVPAPFAGTIKEVKVKLGDALSEGSLVALIEPAGDAAAAPRAEPEAPKKGQAVKEQPASETGAQVQPVDVPAQPDRLTEESIIEVEGGAPVPAQAPVAGDPADPASRPPLRFEADAVLPGKVPYASPAVRLFARELGVDLAQVTGTQRGGRIGKEDVQRFVKAALSGGTVGGASAPTASGSGLNLIPWPKVDFAKFGEIEAKPLSRIQKISGANLARNWAMIPHVTQHDDADITELEALRVALNEENAKAIAAGKAGKLTMLAFLIKASVAALKKYPNFNASLDGDNLVLKRYYNIGFAADTPNGLVVPVLRDADKKGVMQIAQEMGELAALAREGKLKPEQMQGGCFTISSLGGIGGTAFTPIINAPEVAILGVSKSDMKPVWNGEKFKPRLVLPLSLSYDHRVIDGAAAARFTAYLAQLLGDLRRAML